MTLTLDLEAGFKVTAHSLPKETKRGKYKPYDPKGRENENMLRTSHVKWTDRLINISGS